MSRRQSRRLKALVPLGFQRCRRFCWERMKAPALLGTEAPLLDRRQDFLLHHPLELPGVRGPAEQQRSDRDPIGWQPLQGRSGSRRALGQALGLDQGRGLALGQRRVEG